MWKWRKAVRPSPRQTLPLSRTFRRLDLPRKGEDVEVEEDVPSVSSAEPAAEAGAAQPEALDAEKGAQGPSQAADPLPLQLVALPKQKAIELALPNLKSVQLFSTPQLAPE